MKTISVSPCAVSLVCLLAYALMLSTASAGDAANPPPVTVKHVDAKAAASLVASNAAVVLDIRTPGEFAGGHIPGATNVDFLAGNFAEKAAKLDRTKTYLVHCASGGRSTRSLPQLTKLGFTNLIHLDGGFKAWQAAGNPVEKK